jgi:hypothetical protein
MFRLRGSQAIWLGLAVLLAPACDAPSRDRDQADLGAAGGEDPRGPVDTIQAQRDSLFSEVAENARLLNQIGDELGKVEGLTEPDSGTVESPASATRERLLHKVQQVTARLADAEKRVSQSRRQLRTANRLGDSLSGRVGDLEKNLADFEAMLESQRTTLTALTERVTSLETENLALRDTITTMETEENTAYYVVGTKEELLERGIIEKQGGSRVLFIFGKRGETLVPARDVDPSQFTQIDIRQVTEIPLPDSSAEYLIASRQNLDALADGAGETSATQAMDQVRFQPDSLQADSAIQGDSLMYRPDSAYAPPPVQPEQAVQDNGNAQDEEQSEAEKQKAKGRVRGAIRIQNPQEFWRTSKFLIVVRT